MTHFGPARCSDSTEIGKPDIEMLNISNLLTNISDIMDVTTKPLIIDGGTSGNSEHFALDVHSLARRGVSAVVIEDKTDLKRNSLLGTDVFQQQETIDTFCRKITMGKAAQITQDFMIIAGGENLILGFGMKDALNRANTYLAAGADGIMIHSRRPSADEIVEFATRFRAIFPSVPLVCVPTSYGQTHFWQPEQAGFNVVIYANHLLRSAYFGMQQVASEILKHGRTLEAERHCLRLDQMLSLIPGTN
jgi:phosphoenolpyruvate phosphomutase